MLLEVKGLHASYGQTRVLHGIDFAIEKGSITALLGANGAGKTTTLRALCAHGEDAGRDPLRRRAHRRHRATEDIVRLGVAHVPDGRGTFLNLSTEENLRLGAYTRARPRRRSRRTSSACSAISRACASAAASRPARSPAASSRCSRCRAR